MRTIGSFIEREALRIQGNPALSSPDDTLPT